jgi:low temperature requirement protein LtrA
MWWLYFDRSTGELLSSRRMAFAWGYGHYLIFASAAAVGAGLAAGVEGHLSARGAGLAVAVPVAVYLVAVWALQIRPVQRGVVVLAHPAAAGLVLLSAFGPEPVVLIAAVLAGLVTVTSPVVRGRA